MVVVHDDTEHAVEIELEIEVEVEAGMRLRVLLCRVCGGRGARGSD